MRHGIAAGLGEAGVASDAQRPLTQEGFEKTRAVARGLRALDVRFDLLLSSPLVRARQTAEIVSSELGRPVVIAPSLASGAGAARLRSEIRTRQASVLSLFLVGHEPDLGDLVSWLLSGGEGGNFIQMKKAAVAALEVAFSGDAPVASLRWLMTPKQLMRVAGERPPTPDSPAAGLLDQGGEVD